MRLALSRRVTRSVLLIEDTDELREMLAEALEAVGYDVSLGCDGADGLARLREGVSPGVILLDMQMPVMDGWGFLAARARDAELAKVPVVVFTSESPPAGPLPFAIHAWLAKSAPVTEIVRALRRAWHDSASGRLARGTGRLPKRPREA